MQRELRLTKKQDFNKVYRHGKSMANHQLVLYVKPNAEVEKFRFGVSASKKIGNAIVRNRIRRLLKEIVRKHQDKIPDHHDLVMIARKPVVDMDFWQLEKSVLHLLRKTFFTRK